MRALLLCLLVAPCISRAGGIYFSDRPGTNTIKAFDFGAAVTRTVGNASDPRGIVFDAVTGRVYYADRGTAELNSYAAAGGSPQNHLTNLTNVADLRPDRVNRIFYWCEENGGLIRKAAFTATGNAGQTVYSGLTNPYYLDLDVTGGRLFWSQNGTGLFNGALGGGAAPAPFFSGGNNNRGIAVDTAGGMVYWVQRGSGPSAGAGVFRQPIVPGTIQTLYGAGSLNGTQLDTPHGIILDLPARKVYWTDTGTNSGSGFNERGISRGDLDGTGAPEAIVSQATGSGQPWDLDLDTRTPSYAEWRARFFRVDALPAVTDKLVDPDTDGALNLAEYAFASPPLHGGSAPFLEPLKVTDGGVDYGAVRFLRRIGATDLTYHVQLSNNLSAWAETLTVQFGTPTPADDGMELVTFRATVPINGNIRVFFRVRVESP
jgi:hypothetical protein